MGAITKANVSLDLVNKADKAVKEKEAKAEVGLMLLTIVSVMCRSVWFSEMEHSHCLFAAHRCPVITDVLDTIDRVYVVV